jgi:acylphosphatase
VPRERPILEERCTVTLSEKNEKIKNFIQGAWIDMARRLILTGAVQGVFCRQYCSQTAKRLGLHGSASNRNDGSVHVLLDTDDDLLVRSFIDALRSNTYGFRFYGSFSTISLEDYSGPLGGDYVF